MDQLNDELNTDTKSRHFWKSSLSFVLEITKTVIISLAIILPIRYFLIQPFVVDGASMQPNFHDKEYLIIDEISYRFGAPERGDVVVFKNPENHKEFYIKRTIGLPGESVKIEDGEIYIKAINSDEFIKINELDYLPEDYKTFSYLKEVDLKDNEYFVLGDNRNNSKDSRIIGPVNKSLIIGKVWFRGLPLNKISTFDSSKFNYGLEITK
ncbi:MAG: signal peptidase I [Patescibacteria group bacterium]|nr:signal peptidase I [Patescibacteria group bacterium]MDD4304113.1 signal peptidase I [Patescibacteria group bacterium]MDD4694990.1 signal peptidase I [Patescibacteria group bacterium]